MSRYRHSDAGSAYGSQGIGYVADVDVVVCLKTTRLWTITKIEVWLN
jgi:hypothetical protein